MAPIRPEKLQDIERRLSALGVKPTDLVWQFVRASGSGGQKVNKTSSAVLLKHVPSSKTFRSEKSRSQAENRFFAKRQLIEALELEVQGKVSSKDQAQAKKMRQKNRRKRRTRKKVDVLNAAKVKTQE